MSQMHRGNIVSPRVLLRFRYAKTFYRSPDLANQMLTPVTKKPKGKSQQLLDEVPTHSIYANKCGFLTMRPLNWAGALEKRPEYATVTHNGSTKAKATSTRNV